MFLSRAKAIKNAAAAASTASTGGAAGGASASADSSASSGQKLPDLNHFIDRRDFLGAVTLLSFQKSHPEEKTDTVKLMQWIGYAAFHLGDYAKALETYRELLALPDADPTYHLFAACCLFYLGLYKEADAEAQRGPATRLQNRILFQISHKLGDEARLMQHHQKLTEAVDDQLCLAAIHYLRSHFQNATDVYKRLLIECREHLALNVYVALCYYKLDYYDVSMEILAPYLEKYPDSAIGINLRACNTFRLSDGRAAEAELRPLLEIMAASPHNFENDLIAHNKCVFRDGENALQVFPPLASVVPEARLNLIIYHLRNDELAQAFALVKDLEPTTPQEYILKGVVHAALGQAGATTSATKEHLRLAQQFFQLVGASASECDTIPGRQCMASCFFLMQQFDDVMVYFKSIRTYFTADPTFNYNLGVALCKTGAWAEAIDAFASVTADKYRAEYAYHAWLARALVMAGRARDAWELYVKMDTTPETVQLLVQIANDCYKCGSFYFAAKAFDMLEKLDGNPEYWEGKRGACAGVLQAVLAGRLKRECLRDVFAMLRSNAGNPQAELMLRVIKKWSDENDLKLM